MILLTDEEIQAIIKSAPEPYDEYLALPIDLLLKAQLKKVADLLKSCDGELVSRNEGPFMATFEMLATDYQALLEEVK